MRLGTRRSQKNLIVREKECESLKVREFEAKKKVREFESARVRGKKKASLLIFAALELSHRTFALPHFI